MQAYADDLVLISPTASGLQILIDKVSTLIDELGFRINLGKTVSMVFRKKTKHVYDELCFNIGNTVLKM